MNTIGRLRKLEQEATPGPWKHWEDCPWDDDKACGYDSRQSHRGAPYLAPGPRAESSDAASKDAALITAMRNSLPKLLALVEAVEALETSCPGAWDDDVDEIRRRAKELLDE